MQNLNGKFFFFPKYKNAYLTFKKRTFGKINITNYIIFNLHRNNICFKSFCDHHFHITHNIS